MENFFIETKFYLDEQKNIVPGFKFGGEYKKLSHMLENEGIPIHRWGDSQKNARNKFLFELKYISRAKKIFAEYEEIQKQAFWDSLTYSDGLYFNREQHLFEVQENDIDPLIPPPELVCIYFPTFYNSVRQIGYIDISKLDLSKNHITLTPPSHWGTQGYIGRGGGHVRYVEKRLSHIMNKKIFIHYVR